MSVPSGHRPNIGHQDLLLLRQAKHIMKAYDLFIRETKQSFCNWRNWVKSCLTLWRAFSLGPWDIYRWPHVGSDAVHGFWPQSFPCLQSCPQKNLCMWRSYGGSWHSEHENSLQPAHWESFGPAKFGSCAFQLAKPVARTGRGEC